MGFGFGVLRLSPKEFWEMTPRELGAAVGAMFPTDSKLDRVGFAELMKRYPDGEAAEIPLPQPLPTRLRQGFAGHARGRGG